MTRDDIIRMAREAGMFKLFGDPNAPEALTGESIERFAALVAAAEREACAKVCDAEATIEGIAQRCAAAIRARGQA
jgi:hypothetical protein